MAQDEKKAKKNHEGKLMDKELRNFMKHIVGRGNVVRNSLLGGRFSPR